MTEEQKQIDEQMKIQEVLDSQVQLCKDITDAVTIFLRRDYKCPEQIGFLIEAYHHGLGWVKIDADSYEDYIYHDITCALLQGIFNGSCAVAVKITLLDATGLDVNHPVAQTDSAILWENTGHSHYTEYKMENLKG